MSGTVGENFTGARSFIRRPQDRHMWPYLQRFQSKPITAGSLQRLAQCPSTFSCEETLGLVHLDLSTVQFGVALTRHLGWLSEEHSVLSASVRVRLKDQREQRETVFCVTSLSPQKADATRLLTLNRGHWSIENRLHDIRDRTFGEDRSQVPQRAAPHLMASLRTLAIGLLRLAGATTIAVASRFFMRHTEPAMNLLGVPLRGVV